MFSYFEPNFIEKFFWESGFSNFGHMSVFFFFFFSREMEISIFSGRHFETVNVFQFSFTDLWLP